MSIAKRLFDDLPRRGYAHRYTTKGTVTTHTFTKGERVIEMKFDVTRKNWAEINDTAAK
jgi:hypothetical protein